MVLLIQVGATPFPLPSSPTPLSLIFPTKMMTLMIVNVMVKELMMGSATRRWCRHHHHHHYTQGTDALMSEPICIEHTTACSAHCASSSPLPCHTTHALASAAAVGSASRSKRAERETKVIGSDSSGSGNGVDGQVSIQGPHDPSPPPPPLPMLRAFCLCDCLMED